MELHNNLSITPQKYPYFSHSEHLPQILLIEDHPIIQKIHLNFLRMLNCQVSLAETGKKAISMAEQRFDVILLDIGLPDASGLEVAKQIQQQPANRLTPIIGVTAYGKVVEHECLSAGFKEVAVKPVALETFYDIIARYM